MTSQVKVPGVDVTAGLARFQALSPEEQRRRLMAASPAAWAQLARGFTNAPFHTEWYQVAERYSRAAIIAPRDHGKSEALTINRACWHMIYREGTWVLVFAATMDQAQAIKARVDEVLEETAGHLMMGARTSRHIRNARETRLLNSSRITVGSAGKAVRGGHPDLIIGDDVLEEKTCLTKHQRDKTARWWNGTVANMAHSGTVRRLPSGIKKRMPPTRITLVGTPFHRSDLLMSMRDNDLYAFRRYAAEYDPERLPQPGASLAVEIS